MFRGKRKIIYNLHVKNVLTAATLYQTSNGNVIGRRRDHTGRLDTKGEVPFVLQQIAQGAA
jgi:hypothetical protein